MYAIVIGAGDAPAVVAFTPDATNGTLAIAAKTDALMTLCRYTFPPGLL
jgi:hypothetical protein